MTRSSRMPTDRRHFEALGALVVANIFWALSFPVVKIVAKVHERLDPAAGGWFITSMTVAPRFLLGAIVVTLWFLWRRRGGERGGSRPARRELLQGLALGLFAAGGILFQNDGMQHTHASTSAFLSQTYAVLIPVWVAIQSRRAPSPLVGVAIAMVLVGGGVLAQFNFQEMRLGRGETETLIGSLFFTGQILVLGRADCVGNRPLPVTMVMFATEAAVFCGFAGALAPEAAALFAPFHSGPWVVGTAVLTVFCTIGAFSLMNTYQPRITVTEAGLIYCVEPVFAAGLALFLPGLVSAWAGIEYANESFTNALLIGGTLITVANVLVQLQQRPVADPTCRGEPAAK